MLNDSNSIPLEGTTTSIAPPKLSPKPGASLVITGTPSSIIPTSKKTLSPNKFSSGIPYLSAYAASLDFKIWAKDATAVSCYFTKVDTGQKILLTVFRNYDTREYILNGIDFKECPNANYLITVEVNSKGNIKFKNAKEA